MTWAQTWLGCPADVSQVECIADKITNPGDALGFLLLIPVVWVLAWLTTQYLKPRIPRWLRLQRWLTNAEVDSIAAASCVAWSFIWGMRIYHLPIIDILIDAAIATISLRWIVKLAIWKCSKWAPEFTHKHLKNRPERRHEPRVSPDDTLTGMSRTDWGQRKPEDK